MISMHHTSNIDNALYWGGEERTETFNNSYESAPTFNQTQFHVGGSSDTLPILLASTTNEPRRGAARGGRHISARGRQRNANRMKQTRELISREKDKVRSLLPRREGGKPCGGELRLWTETAEYIEYLEAENYRLKRKLGNSPSAPVPPNDDFGAMVVNQPIWDNFTSAGLPITPGLHWKETTPYERAPESIDLAGPSNLREGSSNVDAWAATMMTAQDSDLDFSSPPDPVWDMEVLLTESENYLAEWDAMLEQSLQAGVHDTKNTTTESASQELNYRPMA